MVAFAIELLLGLTVFRDLETWIYTIICCIINVGIGIASNPESE